MSDFIKQTVSKFSENLHLHLNKGEIYRVRNYKNKGSLWINSRYKGFRLQTTSDTATILDGEIERLAGKPNGADKPQEYKYWFVDDYQAVEKIIEFFAKS